MKKITMLFLVFVMFSFANATIYLDEIFDYADGELKTKSDWITGGNIGTWASDFMVQSPALTYSNAGGIFALSGLGKVMSCNYTTGSANYLVYKSFSSSPLTSGIVYVTFLYSPYGEAQSQSQSPVISMSVPGINTGVQVWVGKGVVNPTDFRFGTTRGSTTGADIKWASAEFSNRNDVYLVVLKYDLDTQTASIFINPTLGNESEPASDASDATSTSSVRNAVQTIQFKVNGGSKEVYMAGSVRVSTTWAEAVAVKSTAPKLSAPVVGAASLIGAENFTANWTPWKKRSIPTQ